LRYGRCGSTNDRADAARTKSRLVTLLVNLQPWSLEGIAPAKFVKKVAHTPCGSSRPVLDLYHDNEFGPPLARIFEKGFLLFDERGKRPILFDGNTE
jgi:hypothetical protein